MEKVQNPFNELAERGKFEHFQEFDRIAHLIGVERLISFIPASREEVAKALQVDEHLNNIQLAKWDAQHKPVQSMGQRAKAGWGANKTAWALCETVCTLKHVARYYYHPIEDHSEPTWENQLWHANRVADEKGRDALMNPSGATGKDCGCGSCYCCAALHVAQERGWA